MKILTVLGARPQFIKASIVSDVIKSKYKNVIKEIIVHTGQHYDFEMSNIFFGELKIQKPKYFLNVSKLNHTKMISKMIIDANLENFEIAVVISLLLTDTIGCRIKQ